METCGDQNGNGSISIWQTEAHMERLEAVKEAQAANLQHLHGVHSDLGFAGMAARKQGKEKTSMVECKDADQTAAGAI